MKSDDIALYYEQTQLNVNEHSAIVWAMVFYKMYFWGSLPGQISVLVIEQSIKHLQNYYSL